MACTGNANITDQQIGMVLKRALGADAQDDEGLRAAVRRTDGQARQLMIEAVVAGKGSDQRALVETSLVPIAIVNGQDDLGRNSSPAYSYGITYALRVRLQAIFDVERGSVVGTAELPR